MYHDQRADNSGGKSPGCLERVFELVISVSELDAVCLREVIAEVVAGTGLQSSAVVHERFDGIGCDRACEFLLVGLAALDRGDGKIFRAEVRVDVKHQLGSLDRLFHSGVDCVSLLPHELSGAKERSGLLLPADNAAPLVVVLGKISVGLDFVLVEVTEQGLGSGTHADSLLQLFLSAVSNPCNFRREAVDQVALFAEQVLRDHHGKIHVLYADCLEARVEVLLYSLPQRVARGLVDHESLDVGIGDQSRLNNNVCIPLCEILIHGCDLSYQFLLFCHLMQLLSHGYC